MKEKGSTSRLYIAGPVTGMPKGNRPAFESAWRELVYAGYRAFVPHWIVPEDAIWEEAMKLAIGAMLRCDGVALIEGWERSAGALMERGLATQIGMEVHEIEEWKKRAKGGRALGGGPRAGEHKPLGP